MFHGYSTVTVLEVPPTLMVCSPASNVTSIDTTRNWPSSSAKQHGLGLSVIRGIAEQHDGSADFTVTEDGWFIAKVMLLISDI